MELLGKICVITVPIALVLFIWLVFYVTRRREKKCKFCDGDLVKVNYGFQCPSCKILFEDLDDDKLNIS